MTTNYMKFFLIDIVIYVSFYFSRYIFIRRKISNWQDDWIILKITWHPYNLLTSIWYPRSPLPINDSPLRILQSWFQEFIDIDARDHVKKKKKKKEKSLLISRKDQKKYCPRGFISLSSERTLFYIIDRPIAIPWKNILECNFNYWNDFLIPRPALKIVYQIFFFFNLKWSRVCVCVCFFVRYTIS